MKSSIYAQFSNKSKVLCDNSSFINFGKTNAFVKNGMLFSFSIMKWHYKTYMIYFGVEALCGNINNIDLDNHRVEELADNESIETSSIDELWSYVEKNVIPFFDKCTDAQNAIYAVIDLEYYINDLRLAYLNKKNIKDCGDAIEKRIYLSEQLLYLSMKALDYETLLNVTDKLIELKRKNITDFPELYKKYRSSGYLEFAETWLKKAEDEKLSLMKLTEYYNHAIEKDDLYFSEVVYKREQESIRKLPKKLFKLT